jgi:cytochrome c oxidase cbb3-type subunit 3
LLAVPPLRLCASAAVLALLAVACDQEPSADSLKVWSAGDHHSADDDKAASGAQAAPGQAQPARGDETAQLVELAWRQQCSSCHGNMGRGDGQMGPMVQAPDLTREDWQSRVSDADIAAIIKSGRNKMPAFGTLPDPVVQGLVARIRQLRGR